MDLSSILNIFLKGHAWVLKITGQKLVPLENYKEEVVEINLNYESSKMVEEKSRGAKFYWSEKMYHGYEKYFEIEGNTRKYFIHKKQNLLIDRNPS